MSDDTLKYITSIAVRNYTRVALMVFGILVCTIALGDPANVILLKLSAAPFFFLSTIGLKSIYRQPIVEHKITARAVEYHLLQALLIALIALIVYWSPEKTIGMLVVFFAIMLIIISAIKYFELTRKVKAIANRKAGNS